MTPPSELTVLERLHKHLDEHVSSETGLIAAYRQLAEAPDTPEAARYLIRVVLEDEQRHHRLFQEMTAAVGNDLNWTHRPDAVPSLPYGPSAPALEEATAAFLVAEQADEKQLHALRKELRPFRDTTLWGLLIELMEHDTAKHILLLNFIRDHVVRQKT